MRGNKPRDMPTEGQIKMQHRVKLILYEIYKSIKCYKDVLILIRNTNSSYISIFSNLFIDQIYIYKGLINVFF